MYDANIAAGGVSPAGTPVGMPTGTAAGAPAAAKTVAVGGTAELFPIGLVVVHEASKIVAPTARTQLAATRRWLGPPQRKPRFDPSGPMMKLSLVFAIEGRKFRTRLLKAQTAQEQKGHMPWLHTFSRQST